MRNGELDGKPCIFLQNKILKSDLFLRVMVNSMVNPVFSQRKVLKMIPGQFFPRII